MLYCRNYLLNYLIIAAVRQMMMYLAGIQKYVEKDDIIHTALRLFNANSYNSVGVDRIIQESGVAKMTFYKYFPSKARLIEECLDQRNMNLQESLTASLDACDENDFLGRIKAIYYWYSAWFHTDDFNGCMFQKQSKKSLKSILPPFVQHLNIKNG